MEITKTFEDIGEDEKPLVGGKAWVLSILARKGMRVPPGICVTANTYREYLAFNNLEGIISIELGRKDLKDMRWEEIWDTSLRIRNAILRGKFPEEMRRKLKQDIETFLKHQPAVVRSSSMSEDSSGASFAGIHESYVDVRGSKDVLNRISMVWTSLWSDAALVYQKEMGVNMAGNGMAVIVQSFVKGDKSGVAFSENPMNPSEMVIESVSGLNKFLVDGITQPHRWMISKKGNKIASYEPPFSSSREGLGSEKPPLSKNELNSVVALVRKIEGIFNCPQDVEWTFHGKGLFILQARPITKPREEILTERSAFDLKLHRSFEALNILKKTIESEHLPAMSRETESFEAVNMSRLTGHQLAAEIEKRIEAQTRWNKIYWRDFIPYGHGMRLFGKVYNDVMMPGNPHEFVELLRQSDTLSAKRNRILERMASICRRSPKLISELLKDGKAENTKFNSMYTELLSKYTSISQGLEKPEILADLLKKISSHKKKRIPIPGKNTLSLKRKFIARFERKDRKFASKLLELGCSSYIMRDDDNVYIEGIAMQLRRAANEARNRLKNHKTRTVSDKKLHTLLANPAVKKAYSAHTQVQDRSAQDWDVSIRPKQLRGQPASPGIGTGKARLIMSADNLREFQPGEILLCDAIGPEMTYIIPMAAAIIERRGGMLIHGAIIAREYGIPCVTGVPDATNLIKTGDMVSVDGYLGIVTIDSESP